MPQVPTIHRKRSRLHAPRLVHSLCLLTALIFLSALQPFSLSALSQSVRWEPAGGSLAKGQTTQLQLVFENCQPQGNNPLPPVPGLNLSPNGSQSTNFSSINGRTTQTLSFGVNAQPSTDQHITIPSFSISTDKGPVTVPAANFEVGAATVPSQQGSAALRLDQVVSSQITVPATVWAGEVFPLTYSITGNKRFLNTLGSKPDWDPAPLATENLPDNPRVSDILKNGEPWANIAYNTRAIARLPGNIPINPARQVVNLITGTPTSFDAIFGRMPVEQYTITSSTLAITVNPLPAGAPASFSGAVGQFTLESKVVTASTTAANTTAANTANANTTTANAAVGEPVTWTLTLSGAGNWPDITALPPRSVSKDFRAIQPALKRTPGANNALFDATLAEDIVLIPTQPGAYTLGPVEWTYFDPAQNRYVTITTPATTVTIAPSANAAANPFYTGPNNPAATPSSSAAGAAALAAPPAAPGALPGDPLPTADTADATGAARHATAAATPLPHATLALLLLALAFWPLLLWLALALHRARRDDPARPQREARARLAKTLAALDETPAADRARVSTLLQQWQRDTALLWRISQPVPTAEQFTLPPPIPETATLECGGKAKRRHRFVGHTSGDNRDSLKAVSPVADAPSATALQSAAPDETWTRLWTETDRALYRAATPLPDDWTARAYEALAATRAPRFNPLATLRLRNLFPAAAAFAVLLSLFTSHPSLLGATSASATPAQPPDSATTAYKTGDFPAAETAWRARLAAAPTDWAARHNLSLALAQQDRWPEAAAQAVAAFVQRPTDPAVRRNVILALAHAGYAPAPISEITRPGPVSEVALRLSPPQWQSALAISIALAGLAFALLLARAYTRDTSNTPNTRDTPDTSDTPNARAARPRRRRHALLAAAIALFILATIGTIISAFGLHAYGPARDARAVIVWKTGTLRSIPTVADTTQKTTPLPAGTLAIADKQFPGWLRLVFPDGQTGWTPVEDTVALWK